MRSTIRPWVAGPGSAAAPPAVADPEVVIRQARARQRRRRRRSAAVVAASLVASGAVYLAVGGPSGPKPGHRRPAGTSGAVASVNAAAFAQVPRFFVALIGKTLPDQGQRAVVVATATGAVLGRVSPPRPHCVFTWVAAAGDDRTFVLAVQHAVPVVGWPAHFSGAGPARFYRLVLGRSGRPGPLTALPAPPVTGDINGFALSPDGSKLAVTVSPPVRLRQGRPPPPRGSRLRVFALATGAERDWVLPGIGWIGDTKPYARSLSWAGDDRTLLVQERLGQGGPIAKLRLLDTATPGGSLPAASKRVPIPSADISGHAGKPPLALYGPLLMTGGGTKIAGTTGATTAHRGPARQQRLRKQRFYVLAGLSAALHKDYVNHASRRVIQQAQQRIKQAEAKLAQYQPTFTTVVKVIEVSVRTGQPLQVLGQREVPGIASQWVLWTNPTGTALIVAGPGPQATQRNQQLVLAVQAGNSFTPLPKGVQSFLGQTPTW